MSTELVIDGEISEFAFDLESNGELMIEVECDFGDLDDGLARGYLTRAEAIQLRDFLTENLR